MKTIQVMLIALAAIAGTFRTNGASEDPDIVTTKFDANGGDQVFDPVELKPGSQYGTLPTAIRNFHLFEGWFTASSGGIRVTEASTATSDRTLYAHWKKLRAPEEGFYCVIDVSGGKDAETYPVTYLASEPAGGWTDEYKTTKIVLRRILPGSFKQGEGGVNQVTLTTPFHMGVFAVTQRQYELVMGSATSSLGDTFPVHKISWNTIRGDSRVYDWPKVRAVDPMTFIGKLQARTGLNLDLPTAAEWEYACRAGTTTTFSFGNTVDSKYLWYDKDSGDKLHEVGQKLPNGWGLYDMHGNVWEECLDWYGDQEGGTDPLGPVLGTYRVTRGGCALGPSYTCTSANLGQSTPKYSEPYGGFRLVAGAPKEGGAWQLADGVWSILDAAGVLTVGGTGVVPDRASYSHPWADSVKVVEIRDGVTGIGAESFAGCVGVTSVVIPQSVTSIGSGAFAGCDALAYVTVGLGEKERIGELLEGSGFVVQVEFEESLLAILEDECPVSTDITSDGPCEVTFEWKGTRSGCTGEIVFEIDDWWIDEIDNPGDYWSEVSVLVESGTHTLTWTFDCWQSWNYYGMVRGLTVRPAATIRFDANGGKPETIPPEVRRIGKSYGELPAAHRTGYLFDGWYTAASGGTKVTTKTTVTSDRTLYAHWRELHAPEAALYCVIDLSGGSGASSYPVAYLDAPPGGGWTDEYKTTKLVLRYVQPGEYRYGSRKSEISSVNAPFYMGIFEVTQKQYELVMGENPSSKKGDKLPVEKVSWRDIRGDSKVYKLYESHGVDPASFFGKIQSRTGLYLDLPNLPLWRRAAQAGTSTEFYFGTTDEDADGSVWYEPNADQQTHEVGTKLPNAWGFHDMYGNVEEWILYASNVEISGIAGGGYSSTLTSCSPYTYSTDYTWRSDSDRGFRIAAELPKESVIVIVTFDGNGGSSAQADRGVGSDGRLPSLPTATRDGYAFAGWFTEPSGGTRVTAETVYASDQTVYAHWTANTYRVSYDGNGGSGSMATADCTYDQPYEVAANEFARVGWEFKGWATVKNGPASYHPGDKVLNLTSVQGGVVKLYAIWGLMEIVVSDPNGKIVVPAGADAANLDIKVMVHGQDIRPYLDLPAVKNGEIDLSLATVKDEVVKEVFDTGKGAMIELDAANPTIVTAATKPGLTYAFREGRTLKGFRTQPPSSTKIGDGTPWTVPVSVKGGTSAYYSVDVGK